MLSLNDRREALTIFAKFFLIAAETGFGGKPELLFLFAT
jgi:hypothetical protein